MEEEDKDFEEWWEQRGRDEARSLGIKQAARLGWDAGNADAWSKKHDDT